MNYQTVYRQMHRSPRNFSGYSIKASVDDIALLAERTRLFLGDEPLRLLDYGCGKGYQYLEKRVHEKWGGELPYCYDPGVPQLSEKPSERFHGVICTDVMEHIEEADVPAVLSEIFDYVADGPSFACFYISCRSSRRKRLPDGRDVHVTIKPPEWWEDRIRRFHREDGLIIHVRYDEK